MKKRKPTRRDLLVVVGRLQNMFGKLIAAAGDRNPERAKDIADICAQGVELCIEARSYEPPIEGQEGPWGEDERKGTTSCR